MFDILYMRVCSAIKMRREASGARKFVVDYLLVSLSLQILRTLAVYSSL